MGDFVKLLLVKNLDSHTIICAVFITEYSFCIAFREFDTPSLEINILTAVFVIEDDVVLVRDCLFNLPALGINYKNLSTAIAPLRLFLKPVTGAGSAWATGFASVSTTH